MVRQYTSIFVFLEACLLSMSAAVGAYPENPIRWVIPFPAGGGADIVGRVVAHKLSEIVGQQVVIDNRGGASGNIAAELVARAAPDGYTLLMPHASIQTVNAALYEKLSYDPEKDFVPITLLTTVPNMLAVHPSVPVRSTKEFIALAKKFPGKLTFGSSGNGTAGHLANELLKSEAGIHASRAVQGRGAGAGRPAVRRSRFSDHQCFRVAAHDQGGQSTRAGSGQPQARRAGS